MADEISLTHTHQVVDDDTHFIIDGNSRTISNASEHLPVLIQDDHNSEQFTFEVPKVIDGHDMTLCNHVEVHYINVDKTNIDNTSASRYDVSPEDIKPKADDPDTLVFHWVIDNAATKWIGPLNFAVSFRCVEPVEVIKEVTRNDGTKEFVSVVEDRTTYRLNIKPFIGVNVEEGMDVQQAMSDQYADVVEQWETIIEAYGSSSKTMVENAYNTAVSNFNNTVDGAKTSAIGAIDAHADDVKKDITAETLRTESIIVQTTEGASENRILSHKTTVEELTRIENESKTRDKNIEASANTKFSKIDKLISGISGTSALKPYEHITATNGLISLDDGFEYYVIDTGSNPWSDSKLTVTGDVNYMFHNNGVDISKHKVFDSGNENLLDRVQFETYLKYHKFRVLDVLATYSVSCKRFILDNAQVDRAIEAQNAKDTKIIRDYNDENGLNGTSSYFSWIATSSDTYTGSDYPEGYRDSSYYVAALHVFSDGWSCRTGGAGNPYPLSANKIYEIYKDVNGNYYTLENNNGVITYRINYEVDGRPYVYTTTLEIENSINYVKDTHPWNSSDVSLSKIVGYYVPSNNLQSPYGNLYIINVTEAYRTAVSDPWVSEVLPYTIEANGISSVTGPVKNGLKDTYTIVFDNGNTKTFDVNHGKGIISFEKISTVNDKDTYEIRFNDGTKQTFTVPNVEANRAYLEGNVDDVHTTLNKAGVTSVEHVSEVTSLVDIPEKTTKFARLNSFGGMSNKIVVPTAQGVNMLPFPYAGNNFGTDGAGTVELNSTYGYSVAIIDETNPWTVPDTGMYEQAYRFTNCSALGQGAMLLAYTHDGVEMSSGDIPTTNLTYDVVLKPGDVVTRWVFYGENAAGLSDLTVQPLISTAAFDSETDEWVYYDLEWVPRVAQYRFANTKLQAIKSVDSNDEVVHTYTIPSDIPTPNGFEDVAGNKHTDSIDVSSQVRNRNVSVLRCTGAENWRDYVGGTNTRPSGVYVYALNLADKKPGLTNMTSTIGEYKPDAYDYGNDGEFCGHRSLSTVYFATSKYETLAEWRAELSRWNASGTPLTLYYELAEPVVTDLPTRLDRLIPVEPNGHLIAVTETRDAVTNAVISTGDAVPLDVEFAIISENAGSGGGASNIENGSGTGSIQQEADGVADGFDFTGKNENSGMSGTVPYGAQGAFASSFGGKSAALGKRSHAEGTTTIAQGYYSHAEGCNSVAIGDNSHAEGYKTTSVSEGSHAEGNNTVAAGQYSHVEGMHNRTEHDAAHAEGDTNRAKGVASHAEGKGNIASGDYSHVEGSYNEVKAVSAHAEGQNNIIDEGAEAAHVSGRENHAKHAGAQLLGKGLVSGKQNQTIVGQYNAYDDEAMFIVGNGDDKDHPSNALVVKKDGTIEGNFVGGSGGGDKLYRHELEIVRWDWEIHADSDVHLSAVIYDRNSQPYQNMNDELFERVKACCVVDACYYLEEYEPLTVLGVSRGENLNIVGMRSTGEQFMLAPLNPNDTYEIYDKVTEV